MAEQKFITPLKIGLLAVVTAYFLFTLHGMFTLSWIGEWNRLGGGSFGTMILVEDIAATTGLVFRFAASIIAFAAIIVYFTKKNLSKPTLYQVLRIVLIFEGIYWLGLSATTGYTFQYFDQMLAHGRSLNNLLNSLFLDVIPSVMEAIVLPIVLFVFAFKLNPNKSLKAPVKWGLITGTLYIVVFWLINTSIWIGVVINKGISYLWVVPMQVNGVERLIPHPENLVSFITTVFGLLALAIYSGYITKKSTHIENLQDLKRRAIGGIVLALGLYFLWNYFSWVIFAGTVWNDWYAWFLGHNMDLWMLSLPLVGLPLLFSKEPSKPEAPEKQKIELEFIRLWCRFCYIPLSAYTLLFYAVPYDASHIPLSSQASTRSLRKRNRKAES